MEPTDANVAAVEAAVKSMAGMPKYPTWEPEAQAALIKAFMKKFATPEEAEQAACEFLEYWDHCPTFNDVLYAERVPGSWAAANEGRAALHAAQPECPRCDNTGFAPVEIQHTEMVYDFCPCEFGKLLAGRLYGRANRMDQLRARGVKCGQCHESGEVVREIQAPFSAVNTCDCAVGKMMLARKTPVDAAPRRRISQTAAVGRLKERIGQDAAAGRDT